MLCTASTSNDEQAFVLEIPLKAKDIRHWSQESRPEQLASVAAAGKRARVEVRLKELTLNERELFAEAKHKELNCLGEQILKSR